MILEDILIMYHIITEKIFRETEDTSIPYMSIHCQWCSLILSSWGLYGEGEALVAHLKTTSKKWVDGWMDR